MKEGTCPNCETLLAPADKYCANCGQARIGKEDLRSFLDQFLGDYFTFDSKIVRSVVPLLWRPGFLTTEYTEGRRARYIPPLRMFIFLSILFFLIFGWGASSHAGQVQVDELEDTLFWDRFFSNILPKLFFLFLPLLALVLSLFYPDKPRSLVKPFIFSAHFHAFVFLVFTLYGLLSGLLARIDAAQVNLVLILLVLVYLLVYLWVAVRRVFPRKLGQHVLRFAGAFTAYVLLIVFSAVLAAWLLR